MPGTEPILNGVEMTGCGTQRHQKDIDQIEPERYALFEVLFSPFSSYQIRTSP